MSRALVIGLFLAWFSGCGPGAAERALQIQARSLVASQSARFDFYQAEHDRCSAAADLDAYRACMAPARHVARAVDSYRDSLEAAEAAIRAGEQPLCVAEAAARLVDALESANAPIPSEVLAVTSAINMEGCHRAD